MYVQSNQVIHHTGKPVASGIINIIVGSLCVISALILGFGMLIFPLFGYLIGILAGECFGGFQSDIPTQFLHWGWLICIAVFLLSCVIGIAFEFRKNNGMKKGTGARPTYNKYLQTKR